MVPSKELPCMKSCPRSWHFPSDPGITPDNLFSATSRILRLMELPICDGREPESELRDKLRYFVSEERSPIACLGIAPLSLLYERSRAPKNCKLPMFDGMLPCNWFTSIS